MGWIDKLKQRWNLNNGLQVFVVLFVFGWHRLYGDVFEKPIARID